MLLLPYLEEEELYKQLRLDEPWDSPHNKAVFDATAHAEHFRLSERDSGARTDDMKETSYVMIVGPGTISDGPNSVRLNDITR